MTEPSVKRGSEVDQGDLTPVTDPKVVTLVGRITGNAVDGYLVQILENERVIETVDAFGGAYDPREFRKLKHARRALDSALHREAERRLTAVTEEDYLQVRVP